MRAGRFDSYAARTMGALLEMLRFKDWDDPLQLPIWQRDFWDTQLRKDESYDEKWHYVIENPVRAALVSNSEDWPYQGEISMLDW